MMANFDIVSLFAQDEIRVQRNQQYNREISTQGRCPVNFRKTELDAFRDSEERIWIPAHYGMRNGERQFIPGHYLRRLTELLL